jgi:hypothetical protein
MGNGLWRRDVRPWTIAAAAAVLVAAWLTAHSVAAVAWIAFYPERVVGLSGPIGMDPLRAAGARRFLDERADRDAPVDEGNAVLSADGAAPVEADPTGAASVIEEGAALDRPSDVDDLDRLLAERRRRRLEEDPADPALDVGVGPLFEHDDEPIHVVLPSDEGELEPAEVPRFAAPSILRYPAWLLAAFAVGQLLVLALAASLAALGAAARDARILAAAACVAAPMVLAVTQALAPSLDLRAATTYVATTAVFAGAALVAWSVLPRYRTYRALAVLALTGVVAQLSLGSYIAVLFAACSLVPFLVIASALARGAYDRSRSAPA